MLKGIAPVISPGLIHVLMEMGHGDELVIADGHFPAASLARRLVRADGLGGKVLLDAILRLLPLDLYVDHPAALMAVVPGDPCEPAIWQDYRQVVRTHEPTFKDFEFVERSAFYERTKSAFAVLATGECAQYANLILKKGVVKP